MNIQLWRGLFSHLQKLEKEVIIPMFLVFMTLHLKHCVQFWENSSLKFKKDIEKLEGLVEGCQDG